MYICNKWANGKRIETELNTRRARVHSEEYSSEYIKKICSTYIHLDHSVDSFSTIRVNVLILFVYHTLLISSTHKIRHTKFVYTSFRFYSGSPFLSIFFFICSRLYIRLSIQSTVVRPSVHQFSTVLHLSRHS